MLLTEKGHRIIRVTPLMVRVSVSGSKSPRSAANTSGNKTTFLELTLSSHFMVELFMDHNDKNTMIAQICGSGTLQEVLNKIVSLKRLKKTPTPLKNMFHKATNNTPSKLGLYFSNQK